jgi:hypothetical protein
MPEMDVIDRDIGCHYVGCGTRSTGHIVDGNKTYPVCSYACGVKLVARQRASLTGCHAAACGRFASGRAEIDGVYTPVCSLACGAALQRATISTNRRINATPVGTSAARSRLPTATSIGMPGGAGDVTMESGESLSSFDDEAAPPVLAPPAPAPTEDTTATIAEIKSKTQENIKTATSSLNEDISTFAKSLTNLHPGTDTAAGDVSKSMEKAIKDGKWMIRQRYIANEKARLECYQKITDTATRATDASDLSPADAIKSKATKKAFMERVIATIEEVRKQFEDVEDTGEASAKKFQAMFAEKKKASPLNPFFQILVGGEKKSVANGFYDVDLSHNIIAKNRGVDPTVRMEGLRKIIERLTENRVVDFSVFAKKLREKITSLTYAGLIMVPLEKISFASEKDLTEDENIKKHEQALGDLTTLAAWALLRELTETDEETALALKFDHADPNDVTTMTPMLFFKPQKKKTVSSATVIFVRAWERWEDIHNVKAKEGIHNFTNAFDRNITGSKSKQREKKIAEFVALHKEQQDGDAAVLAQRSFFDGSLN